ncbi:MAG: tRNA (cytidine(34)-2'-O)-methyltransferase [Verrucomicrobiota bacterium]
MIHIILYQPEIPQNTGNIGRMCAITRSRLHLIHPLGFEITDKQLKRSGMDYWENLDVHHHPDWTAFERSSARPRNEIYLFSTHAQKPHWEVVFRDDCGLLFGNEGSGVPLFIHEQFKDARIKIPQWDASLRSLNLATSAGIATYEALRQIVTKGDLGLPCG